MRCPWCTTALFARPTGRSKRDISDTTHGFLCAPPGQSTEFDPSGSTETYPGGINGDGAVAGNFDDAQHVAYGFLPASDGTMTTFDVSGSAIRQLWRQRAA
jgi:hypothetical protein